MGAIRLSSREIMHRGKAGEVGARQHGDAGDVGAVSRQLRPERRLKIEVFPEPVDVHVGEASAKFRHATA